ncbi:hypothetical protein [Streptomyces boluensis]|uniref:Integral membrane protein n=1 Tax=Streptomyces boluensis TaxID=1775135 RepID=A0A964UR13_9ACTN|nr:hypothetical protein [Streptomyces boluensis]NBE51437.1 hypothetical protein [Streptomyces boluensis]
MAAPLPRASREARKTRETRPGAGLRALRAAVFTAVCVALSAGGHILASSSTVPLWSLATGFLVVLVVALPLAGRRRSLPGIAASLTVGQLGLHALFEVGQQGTHTAPASADAALIERAAHLVCGAGASVISPAEARRILTSAGLDPSSTAGAHVHGGGAAAAVQSAAPGMDMSLLPEVPMLLGHLLAGLAAGWLLRRGDLALLRLVELSTYGVEEGAFVRSLRGALALVRVLCVGLPALPGTGVGMPRGTQWARWQPRTAVLDDTVIRRGPPASGFGLAA